MATDAVLAGQRVVAFDAQRGCPVRLEWLDGRLTSVTSTAEPPGEELWVAPPLLDLQVNGYAGIDFQQDDPTVDGLLTAVRALRRDGCTRFLLTLITDDWDRLTHRLRRFVALRREHPELSNAILGWHIEGPFLSAEPGYCGAHDPACMLDPEPGHVARWREITAGTVLLLTLAPERPGAMAAILEAQRSGVRIQLGHTNASLSQLRQAAGDHGVFTHLGNGCPQTLDRHDNIIWRALEVPGLWASLIPDRIHVSPALFRLLHRNLAGRVYYTTDAMSAAGAPPGRFRLGKSELEVGADGIVRLPGRTNFAGSSCTPLAAVFRAASMLGETWMEAWPRMSATPARMIGVEPGLVAGGPADFVLIRPGGAPAITSVWQGTVAGVHERIPG